MDSTPHTAGARDVRNNTRVKSEAVRQSAESKRRGKPLVVEGIGPARLITITPQMYGKLDVDPRYQRGETNMVSEIVRALQAGGTVVDPVTLATREGDAKWYIVDGWQRTNAHMQLGMPFQALLHTSEGWECEATLFHALDNRNKVSPNVTVKGWVEGPSGEIIRSACNDPEHPLHDRVNFNQGSNESRLAAAVVVKGMLAVCGVKNCGKISDLLARLDYAVSHTSGVKSRLDGYMRLLGHVCPKGKNALPSIVVRALGQVARERWENGDEMPTLKQIDRLRTKNWREEDLREKYIDSLLNVIRKIWKQA